MFEQTLLIHNEKGHCFGYQVKVQDKTFYGEGSTAKIAHGLAAQDALSYFKVLRILTQNIYFLIGRYKL